MNKRTFHIQINIHTLRQKKKSPIQKMYSKASRYLASSCTDLAGALFWIGSKKIWAARFFEHLGFTLLSNKSCTNFELHEFFLSPKKRASQGLTVIEISLTSNRQFKKWWVFSTWNVIYFWLHHSNVPFVFKRHWLFHFLFNQCTMVI